MWQYGICLMCQSSLPHNLFLDNFNATNRIVNALCTLLYCLHIVLIIQKSAFWTPIFILTIKFPIVSFQAMFIENTFLLLASSWMFSMVSWDTVGIPAAVFCSFLIGETHCTSQICSTLGWWWLKHDAHMLSVSDQ